MLNVQFRVFIRILMPDQLINKGVIYATAHGEVDFTVPGFDDYLKRMNPELKISEEIV